MEKVVLIGIGAAAFLYIAYLIWRSINGKGVCNCSNSSSCQGTAGNCHCKSQSLPK